MRWGRGRRSRRWARATRTCVSVGPPEQSNQRLLGALERLEKRIHELEHTAHPPLHEPAPHRIRKPAASAQWPAGDGGAGGGGGGSGCRAHHRAAGQGPVAAEPRPGRRGAGCFDQVLALDANHPEALVKKGAALERLRKLDEAIACYDRAIAADSSLTVAYLYKGGLFNRMERFSEALECYEQALRTQEARRG